MDAQQVLETSRIRREHGVVEVCSDTTRLDVFWCEDRVREAVIEEVTSCSLSRRVKIMWGRIPGSSMIVLAEMTLGCWDPTVNSFSENILANNTLQLYHITTSEFE
jgi:hypothetical protein